jgi:hypothetical protein
LARYCFLLPSHEVVDVPCQVSRIVLGTPADRLYDTWLRRIIELLPGERITRVRNLVWLIVGMGLSRSVHLSPPDWIRGPVGGGATLPR